MGPKPNGAFRQGWLVSLSPGLRPGREKRVPMADGFAKIAGPLQALLGVVTAASPQAAAAVGAGAGASGFNIVSGVALGVLGFRGGETGMRTGSQVLGGINLLVGVLGLLGI